MSLRATIRDSLIVLKSDFLLLRRALCTRILPHGTFFLLLLFDYFLSLRGFFAFPIVPIRNCSMSLLVDLLGCDSAALERLFFHFIFF